MLDQIKWLGHGSYVIEGPPLIYIDPWRVTRTVFHADVILISHDHYDHFSMADITKLRGPDTIIIGNPSIVDQVDGATLLRPWQSMTVDKANIKAVPAYTPGSIQHPPEANGLGFIISVNLYDIYYAGDTGIIPEMEKIRPDIAILPLDGNDTLNIEDAVHVIKLMRPRWVLPSNWASTADSATLMDVKELKDRVQDYTDVIIPEQAR
jgi:L-ascorbate metabolism protein UlaG (beta-lactamase superfamily)